MHVLLFIKLWRRVFYCNMYGMLVTSLIPRPCGKVDLGTRLCIYSWWPAGCSLCQVAQPHEYMYIHMYTRTWSLPLTRSAPLWEMERKPGQWSRVKNLLNEKLELAYSQYLDSPSREALTEVPNTEFRVLCTACVLYKLIETYIV